MVTIFRQLGGFALGAALLLASVGCAYKSSPVSALTERRLLAGKLTDAQFGGVTTDGGRSMRFSVFEGSLPVRPFSVPMIESYRDLPGLSVKLNGRHKVNMLADTGAQLCIFDANSVLAGRGRTYVPENLNVSVTGIGGNEDAWLARFDHVDIGSIELRNFTGLVRRQKTVVRYGPLPMRNMPINLLGCPVFLAFDHVTFDYPRKRFLFSGHTAYQPPQGAWRIPMTVEGQLIYVPLRIGTRTVAAMVDTGAKDQIFLSTRTVKKLGLTAAAETGGKFRAIGLGGETSGRQFKVPLAFLGEVPVQDVTIDTADSTSWDARIGSEILSRWKTTFDFRNRSVWVEPPGR